MGKLLYVLGIAMLAIAAVCLVKLLLNPFQGPSDNVWTLTGIGVGVMGLLLMSVGTMMKRGDI